jgi:hypothetical protein
MSIQQFIQPDDRQYLDSIKKSTIQTTDNTLTTIATIPITVNEITIINALVRGIATNGDGLGFSIVGVFKIVDGLATQIGTSTTDAKRDQANWNVSFAVSEGNVLLKVLGAISNTINWKAQYELITI